MTKKNNMLPIAAGVVIVIVILAAAVLLSRPTTPVVTTPVTTAQPGITTQTVQTVTTTVISNLSTAIGPNLASCNGYDYNISQADLNSVGSCSWRGGFMNITITSGGYNNVVLTLLQQNTTTAPYNSTYSVNPCTTQSGVYRVPIGSYVVSFAAGSAATCTPGGNATVRLSK